MAVKLWTSGEADWDYVAYLIFALQSVAGQESVDLRLFIVGWPFEEDRAFEKFCQGVFYLRYHEKDSFLYFIPHISSYRIK